MRFWEFAATRVGSLEESRIETGLMKEHQGFAVWSARRFWGAAEQEDLRQVGGLALLRAVRCYIPTIGPFGPYAMASCIGALRGYLSDCYYEGIPAPLRSRYALVRRACGNYFEEQGRMPTERELAEELPVPHGEIRDALVFHSRRRALSLDAPATAGGRPLSAFVADSDAQAKPSMEPAGGRLIQELQEAPDIAAEIERQLADPDWIAAMAARAELNTDDVARLLREATKLSLSGMGAEGPRS